MGLWSRVRDRLYRTMILCLSNHFWFYAKVCYQGPSLNLLAEATRFGAEISSYSVLFTILMIFTWAPEPPAPKQPSIHSCTHFFIPYQDLSTARGSFSPPNKLMPRKGQLTIHTHTHFILYMYQLSASCVYIFMLLSREGKLINISLFFFFFIF